MQPKTPLRGFLRLQAEEEVKVKETVPLGMLDRLRAFFRPTPRTITVRPSHDGEWVVEWRGGKYRNHPSSYDCETRDEALEWAGRKRFRMLRDGDRAAVIVQCPEREQSTDGVV